MVTRNRRQLAQRAVACLAAQTWPSKELVIVDDGAEDYEPMLERYRGALQIQYHRVDGSRRETLGALRNRSLDLASGDYCMQWDDDEWYHPSRIQLQMHALQERGLGAVVLKHTLMHLDEPIYVERPYRGSVADGTPGTILHQRCPSVRYPDKRKGEDSDFLRDLSRVLEVGQLDESYSHLFIRCFHGGNTWDRRHFLKRLRRTPTDLLHYLQAKYWQRNIYVHPAFDLSACEKEALELFLAESRALGLING